MKLKEKFIKVHTYTYIKKELHHIPEKYYRNSFEIQLKQS